MKKIKKNYKNFFIYSGSVILLYLLLIGLKEVALGHYLGDIEFSNPIFKLDYALNDGAAFGLMQQQSALLCGIAAFVICLIVYYILIKGKKFSKPEIFSLSVISAGIISNTIERLNTGVVVDYINLNFIKFPIFNFADLFICFGAALLILLLFFRKS